MHVRRVRRAFGALMVVVVLAAVVAFPVGAFATPGTGGISGRVTDTGGNGLASINVYVYQGDSWEWYALTDADGYYTFGGSGEGIGTGEYTVEFEDPAGAYRTEWYSNAPNQGSATPVTVNDGVITTNINEILGDLPSSDILVTSPGYDDFGAILDSLGWGYDECSVAELGTLDLSSYKALYINCASFQLPEGIDDKIATWVDEGGSLYASDWAYSVVEIAFPDEIEFAPDPKSGDSGVYTADILDSGLAHYLDSENPPATVDLNYDLGAWVVPVDAAADATVYMSGTVDTYGGSAYVPLVIGFNHGDGRVLYTTFHNEAQLSELQQKILEYFALIPYTQSLNNALDQAVMSEFPGYGEQLSYLGRISPGQTLSGYPIPPNPAGWVLGVNTGANLSVELKRPDGSVFQTLEVNGGPALLEVPAGSASALAAGDWSASVSGVSGDANAPFVMNVYGLGVNEVVRVAGLNRYATAIEASKRAYPNGAGAVVLATGANWPDALGGSALAGTVRGPLLLVGSSLDPAVKAEIERLGATQAYILGGVGAVPAGIEAELKGMLGTDKVTRLAGTDRYGTANEVATKVVELKGPAFTGTMFVATGGNYPDALAGSPIAAAKGWPIVLVNPNTGSVSWPSDVTDAVILGGTGAVSSATASALDAELSGEVTRQGGANRYATAALVAKYGVAAGMTWNGVGVATGEAFPDALSGGAMLGEFDAVMLLTQSATLTGDATAALGENKDAIDTVHVIGGTGAVSTAVENAVKVAIGQ